MVPVIILGGALGGFVTVTEASVLAAVYVFLYGLVTRTVSWKALFDAAANTALAMGLFGFIIAAAGPFSFFLALYRAPEAVGNLLLTLSGGNADVLMLVLTVILLGLGCLVEATSLVIILAPILAGTATVAGIDQLHMALVSITALMIGLFTPPVGTNLFAVVSISGEANRKDLARNPPVCAGRGSRRAGPCADAEAGDVASPSSHEIARPDSGEDPNLLRTTGALHNFRRDFFQHRVTPAKERT